MKHYKKGQNLIRELLESPEKFVESKKGYSLLNEYQDGFPSDTLRPLLRSNNETVRQEAIQIASELDEDARVIIGDVLPLLNDANLDIRFYALIALAGFASQEQSDKYVHVVRSLESPDIEIRLLSINLVSLANDEQLGAAIEFFDGNSLNDKTQNEGLLILRSKTFDAQVCKNLINSIHSISRKYGAIVANKIHNLYPEIINQMLVSEDDDLRIFAENKIEAKRRLDALDLLS